MSQARRLLSLLACGGLAACSGVPPAPVAEPATPVRVEGARTAAAASAATDERVHVVRPGDTLSMVARQYGLSTRDLAAWNNVDNPNQIRPGRRLRLAPPAAPSAAVPASSEAVEVRPVAGGGGMQARPLDGSPTAAVEPAPTEQTGIKREPKGGKLPYSEANLARLKGSAASAPTPPSAAPNPASPSAAASSTPPAQDKSATAAPLASGIDWGWPAGGRVLAGFSDAKAGAQDVNRGIDIAGKMGDPVLAAAAGKVIFVGVYPKHGNLVVLLHDEGFSTVYAHNRKVLVKEGQTVKRGQRIADLGDSDADQPKLHFEVRQQGKPIDPLRLLPSR